MRLLIAEDERDLAEALSVFFEKNQFTVDTVYNGFDAYEYAVTGDYDAIVLDVMMPKLNGVEVLERLRAEGVRTPVMMLTARAEKNDRITGFNAGADDYLPKPFSFAELSARVKALLRRYCVYQGKGQVAAQPENLKLISNGVQLALDCNRVWVEEREVDLTETEYKILRMLMQNPERIFSVEMIYETVWGEPYYYTSNGTVMVHIRNLRTKIEADPQNPKRVCTVWGKGYRFVSEEQV